MFPNTCVGGQRARGETDRQTGYVSVHLYAFSGMIEKLTRVAIEKGKWKFGEQGGRETFFFSCALLWGLKILIFTCRGYIPNIIFKKPKLKL